MSADRPARLRAAVAECERHVRYLEAARGRLPERIDSPMLDRPDDALVASLDQFAYRFARLQDTLGQRLLRLFLVGVLREPFEDAPMRDVLDRLERLGYLVAERWEQYRAVRNALVHDYPEEAEQRAARLMLAFEMAAELKRLLDRLQQEVGD